MFSTIRQKLTDLWQGLVQSRPAPLVNTKHDFWLMQRLHGRRAPSWLQTRFIAKILPKRERLLFFSTLTVFGLAVLGIATGLVLEAREELPAVGGEYVEGVVGVPNLINPIFATSNEADLGLVRLIYSGLMRLDTDAKPVLDLAESLSVSPDQKTYTFTLGKAVWHDGQPVTTKDVAFTFALIQDKAVGSDLFSSFNGVSVTTTDRTITFRLPEVYPAFLSSLTVGIVPEHIWGSVPRAEIKTSEVNNRFLGSGPFQLGQIIKEENGYISRVELNRFPEYQHGAAYLKNLVFQYYPEYEGETGALEALRTQKVNGLGMIPTAYRETAATRHVVIEKYQLPQYTALFFNSNNQSALKNRDVRESLALALNKVKILQDTLDDDGTVINSPVLAGSPGYVTAEIPAPNIEAANTILDKEWARISVEDYKKQLVDSYVREHRATTSTSSTIQLDPEILAAEAEKLVKAELPPAQVFFRRSKDGKDLVLRLSAPDTAEYRLVAGFVAGYWQDIGVRTEITFIDPRDLVRFALKGREYDVLLSGVIVGNDPDQFPFWHSSQIQYPGLNLSGYTNRTVDDILIKIRQTNDAAQLEKLYSDFQAQITRDIPAVFLYSPQYLYGLGKEIKGNAVTKISHPADRFSGVTGWYIKTKSSFTF